MILPPFASATGAAAKEGGRAVGRIRSRRFCVREKCRGKKKEEEEGKKPDIGCPAWRRRMAVDPFFCKAGAIIPRKAASCAGGRRKNLMPKLRGGGTAR